MRCDTTSLVVKNTSSEVAIQSVKLLSLVALLALAGLATGCGAASQAGTSSANQHQNAQIAVSMSAAAAKVGVPYSAVPSVSGGTAPYIFTVQGALPPGTLLNFQTGSISGIPTTAGNYQFTLMVNDPRNTGHGSLPINIAVAASGSINDKSPTISLSPGSTTLVSQGVLQFTASLTGTANTAVQWSASAGTISSNGSFTAPSVTSNTTVTVTVSTSTGSLHAEATVVVTPPAPLTITTSSLTGANEGVPYSYPISATGGTSPYTWSVSTGALPPGFQLQASTGTLAGTTSSAGSFPFTAKVTDSAGHNYSHAFALTVSTNSANGYDGPAELPLIYIQTAMANTPAPGTTTTVKSGGDLQSALNSASCGDTVALQAGATFTGNFTFPAKNCDDNHWIIVRTSSSDSLLPAEGSRLTPCYAGVASLPGRPALNCTSTANVTAKIIIPKTGTGPIVFASGANHYRLIGLEVTRAIGTGIVYSLASVAANGTANNVILDRVWLHGTARDDTKKGFELGGGSYMSAIDSYFTDFHCISVTGACSDASAVSAGANNPAGPYKITDNFLEASGENVMFGGAQSGTTPADIEIEQNHFFKPLTWLKGQAGYVGGSNGNPFVVKNLLEFKNAQRVLVDGNIFEYSWGGFSQNGFAIVITPKNQADSSSNGNLCPNCFVSDITIRYSTASHLGAGLQIANALSDNGGAATAGLRYSIHDLTLDDIDPVTYDGSGHFAEIMTAAGAPLLQSVLLNHITAFPPSGLFSIGGFNAKMPNFTFTNSLVSAGTYPIWSTGGGSTNCAYYDMPITTFSACFSPYAITSNGLIATPSNYPPSAWPSGNHFPASTAAVQFVNYNNGNGGNYELLPSSPYKNAGTDGKDLGADVETILSEIAGVY